jgi:hypothetical protein
MNTEAELLRKLLIKLRADIDLRNAKLSVGYYYTSLPLALTDAVFSIGVRYESVVNAVHHLARRAGWTVYRPHGSPFLPVHRQHTISELLAEFPKVSDPVEVFGNRGYANPAATGTNKIPKAVMVQRVAEVLAANGIETLDDFAVHPDPDALDATICALPSATSGVMVSYLRMLAGHEERIKADRHVHAFIRVASGDSTLVVSNAYAVRLMQEAARHLANEDGLRHLTPRLLDHAVWSAQRQRRTPEAKQGASPQEIPSVSASVQGPGSTDQPGHLTGLHGSLPMREFWSFCIRGGTTPSGLEYRVDEQERLHIVSPRSANKNYKISKRTVTAYLEQLHAVNFRKDHAWFSTVADHALRSLL